MFFIRKGSVSSSSLPLASDYIVGFPAFFIHTQKKKYIYIYIYIYFFFFVLRGVITFFFVYCVALYSFFCIAWRYILFFFVLRGIIFLFFLYCLALYSFFFFAWRCILTLFRVALHLSAALHCIFSVV